MLLAAVFAFELQRHMVDVELGLERSSQAAQELLRLDAGLVVDDVGGQRRLAAGDGPQV